MAEHQDLEIWRGNDAPSVGFIIPINGAASEWRMQICARSGLITFSTQDGTIEAVPIVEDSAVHTRLLIVGLTVERTRLMAKGEEMKYELEQVEPTGGQYSWLEGTIIALGGLNPDDIS